jgi:hypothetical protein
VSGVRVLVKMVSLFLALPYNSSKLISKRK